MKQITNQQGPLLHIHSTAAPEQQRFFTRAVAIARNLRLAILLSLGLAAAFGTVVWGQDVNDAAVRRADAFLTAPGRGEKVLGYVHFGATYNGHSIQKAKQATDDRGQIIPGEFDLIYEYSWDKDGITDVAFRCDPRGNVYKVYITYCNGIIQQPFLLANGAIQALGNVLIGGFKNQMTDDQTAQFRKLVDNADAKGMLELSLQLQQMFGN